MVCRSQYGHFTNERRLTGDGDQTLLVSWADSGAAEGNEKDKPAPVQFAEGWSIGKPDMVVEFPREIQIPATGTHGPVEPGGEGELPARRVDQGGGASSGQPSRGTPHEGLDPAAGIGMAEGCAGR